MNFIRYITSFLPSLCHRNAPSYLILFVTSKCNAQCPFCFNWKNIRDAHNRIELSLEEIEKISKTLPYLMQLTLSGGEPFIRPDLPEIVSIFSNNTSLRFVTLTTNGLLTDKIISTVTNICEQNTQCTIRMSVSIDALYDAHDSIRGVPGMFQKALETCYKLIMLKKNYPNLLVDVATTFSSYNASDIDSVFQFVKEHLPIDNHVMMFARGDLRNVDAQPLEDEYINFTQRLLQQSYYSKGGSFNTFLMNRVKQETLKSVIAVMKRHRMPFPCVAGRKLIVINDTGEVFPCELLDYLYGKGLFPKWERIEDFCYGSLRENNFDLAKILDSPKAQTINKYIKDGCCYCTFECAIAASLVYNVSQYMKFFRPT